MKDNIQVNFVKTIFAVGIVVLIWLISGVNHIQSTPLDYDEGTNLMFGTLARMGYQPYVETFVGIPPAGVLAIQLGTIVFGDNAYVRLMMFMFGLLGALSVFWIVKNQAHYYPAWTAFFAIVFLLYYPNYFYQSATIMVDVPAIAFSLLAIALIQTYQSHPSYIWLFLSGCAYALSLFLKIYVVFLPLIIGYQLLYIVVMGKKKGAYADKSIYAQILIMGGIWLAGIFMTSALFLLIYDPAALYHQVVSFRLADRAVRLADDDYWIYENSDKLLTTFKIYFPLIGGAGLGVLAVGYQRGLKVGVWIIWFVFATLFLFTHVPPRTHHNIILLPPLAALSGIAITHLPPRFKKPVRWFVAPTLLLVIFSLVGLNLFNGTISPPNIRDFDQGTGRHSAVKFIEQTTDLDDYIVADDPRFGLFSGRLVPPYLSEVSHARISTGWLSTEDIIKIISEHNAPILVLGPRFSNLPNLAQIAESLYSLKLLFANTDGGHTITVYAIKVNEETEPEYILNKSLGGIVVLKGADITSSPWRVGQSIVVSNYWQAQTKIAQDYKIFLHLKDSQGSVVHTFDHYPFEVSPDYLITYSLPNAIYRENQSVADFDNYPAKGLLPTRLWRPDIVLKEMINIKLPEDTPPGIYTLEAGLYDDVTLERIAVEDGSKNNHDAVTLTTIEVIE